MRALFIDVVKPLDSKLLDPSQSQELGGGGTVSISTKFDRPIREFSLRSWDTLFRDQMEIIRNEIAAGRITGVFWFNPPQYDEITEPVFIGEGNGSQKEFVMPFPNVFAPSWKIWVGQTLNTGWTMEEEPGVLVFSSAPTGRITGIGKRKYRVIMVDTSGSILNESQLYTNYSNEGVYSMQPITLREANGVDVA